LEPVGVREYHHTPQNRSSRRRHLPDRRHGRWAVGDSRLYVWLAVYVATRTAYGTVYGCLAEVVYCVVVGAAAVGVILLSRSKGRREAVKRAEEEEIERRRKKAGAPLPWEDTGVITTALSLFLKVARMGMRNKTTFGLVAGGIAAAWSAWQATKARNKAWALDNVHQLNSAEKGMARETPPILAGTICNCPSQKR
jgi:hypothetical protein